MTYALENGRAALMSMLTYRRPAFGRTEEAFIDRFLRPLPGINQDAFGNLWLTIDHADGSRSPILWSSHTDSVHRLEGRQNVIVDRTTGIVTVQDAGKASKGLSNCLGADCASGVWIMREMILANVPGTYVFHREEESGGNGSRWLLEHARDWLAQFDFAIAFDRKGYGDVITHQGERTASNAFAKSCAAILGGAYKPDDTGVFTDTAVYASVIPECSNLSVGYFGQHGPAETQDVAFLLALRDTVIAADWSALICERDPSKPDPDEALWWKQSRDWHGGWATTDDLSRADTLERFVKDNPVLVADYLDLAGISLRDLEDHAAYFS